MPVPRTTIRRHAGRIGIVLAVAAATVAGTALPSFAVTTPPTLTLSANQGPSGGGNTITATTPLYTATAPIVPAPTFSGGASIEFQAAATATTACAATYAATSAPTSAAGGVIALPAANLTIISANRISMTIPTGFFTGASTSAPPKYNICAYTGTASTATLLAQTTAAGGQYAIGAQATITAVTPSAGSAQGGTTITVTGTNFPTTSTAITASIGGTPLTNINAVSATSFTAVTPPHAVSLTALPLSVTTAGGTVTKANAFTYSNGITVSPNSGPNTRLGVTPIDVQGLGFSSLTFANTGLPDDTNAHVYLVRGAYDSTMSGAAKTVGEVAECANVLVVSDTEMVCSMNLVDSLDLTHSGAVLTTSHAVTGDTVATSATVSNISPVLTAADVGQRVSGTNIAAGTTITAISNGGATATLSANASATGTTTAITVGAATFTATATSASTALTAVSPALTAADVGKVVTGTGIAANTTIVSQTGTAAVLSLPATGAATGAPGTVTITDSVPVPVGTYTVTIVSNGAGDEETNDPAFQKSIISSGSTYTVADY